MMYKFLILLIAPLYLFAQPKAKYQPLKIDKELKIDGLLKEADWKKAEKATNFTLNYPIDSGLASAQTTAYIMFDDENIYIAAICSFPKNSIRNVRSLSRDFSITENDAFTVVLDPLKDETNGYSFSVNPMGALNESLVHSSSSLNSVWDNKWHAATTIENNCWKTEIRIPFKSLRYKENLNTWGLNFIRNEISSNEISSWQAVPREFSTLSLSYAGELEWTSPPSQGTTNFSIIPYLTTGYQKQENKPSINKTNAGADFKLAITPSLNLDVTVNPDFSQVEADAQVINLDRFSIYFPERRSFFIENEDLFANFGFSKIRPFFTRRIGISDGKLNPIYGGIRLSGKLNENWRVGLLNMQSAPVDSISSNNYGVACFQRQIFGNSNIGGIFVNRQGENNDYNRVLGLDYNLLSKDNRWRGKFFYHQSFTDDNSEFQYAHASWLTYQRRTINFTWNHEFVDKNYSAEVGFVPREGIGYWRLEPSITKYFYINNSTINRQGARLYYDIYSNQQFEKTDHLIQGSYYLDFQNRARLAVHSSQTYVKLQEPFNPNSKDTLLFPADEYSWQSASFSFTPSGRKPIFFSFYGQYGSFYQGLKLTYGGKLSYRIVPYLQLSLSADINQLNMPKPYSDANLVLLSSNLNVSFSKSLFLTSFIQLNKQVDHFGINTRLQWRFKPMSDLYLVYNNSVYTDTFDPINNAILVKLNYWLNV